MEKLFHKYPVARKRSPIKVNSRNIKELIKPPNCYVNVSAYSLVNQDLKTIFDSTENK